MIEKCVNFEANWKFAEANKTAILLKVKKEKNRLFSH